MLSGPAILRISVLLLLAGALAALVQYWLPASPQPRDKTAIATSDPAPSDPAVRKIPSRPQADVSSPIPVPAEPVRRPVPEPSPAPVPTPAAPSVMPSDSLAFPAPPPSAAPQGRAEVKEAETTEGPPAIDLVDLNKASVAELNGLRGGGAIGRAIVAKRPYTQVSDLLSKRVLSRAVYERIKEQVTVR